MSKQTYVIAAGLILWSTAACAAADRPGAIAEMQKSVAELGSVLEAQCVVLQPDSLASNVLEAIIRVIDPGAAIVTPEQAEQFQEEEKGIYYDVGLKLIQSGKRLKIGEVVTNGPAQKADVPVQAIIEQIDGRNTDAMSLAEAAKRLRGRKNEPVILSIRADEKGAEARKFTLTRTVGQTPVTGTQELWPQQIGYLKVNGIFDGSGEQVTAQFQEWSGTNCVGMILDLRGANGTNLDAAAKIAGLFSHPPPTLFTLKDGFNKPLKVYTVSKPERPLDRPVMILVDGDTRGAAETLAAVLQDCQGVMIIGTPSRGDDRMRAPLPIANGKVLYIAVKRIDLGKEDYNGKGIQPDVVVAAAQENVKNKDGAEDDLGLFSSLSEQEKQDRALNTRIGNDLILRRATDILLGLKALNLFKP